MGWRVVVAYVVSDGMVVVAVVVVAPEDDRESSGWMRVMISLPIGRPSRRVIWVDNRLEPRDHHWGRLS